MLLNKIRRYLPVVITVLAFLIFLSGIYLGEPSDVWQKAVSICLSCIGIG